MTTVEKEIKTLDITKKQDVVYAIPLWLRDEQIKLNGERITARIEAREGSEGLRAEPIAIVCFGPSLADTWEQVKDFKFIMTCSGSHKFLLERGIVPTWHVEVDPRAHKCLLLGTPHPDTEYLIASTCHPKLIDHLEGFKVKLWHVFDNAQDAMRTLPRGEWALTGGCSVGLRAMTVARFMGFTDQHIFGMDGSEGRTGKHADAHPNQPKGHCMVEYGGKEYRTTTGYLEAARTTWHELNQMPDVKATFYGDGLVQAMAKDYKPEPVGKGKEMVGFMKPELISAEYRSQNEILHRDNLAYGVGGGRHAPIVLKLVESLKSTCKTIPAVLDYGCGKSYLAKALPFPIFEFDPAVPGKTESPRPADLVVCTDVLEHVERDKLPFVLDDLRRCVRQVGFFVIDTKEAQKTLPDGRNTHQIIKSPDWWTKRLAEFFHVATSQTKGREVFIVVGPLKKVLA